MLPVQNVEIEKLISGAVKQEEVMKLKHDSSSVQNASTLGENTGKMLKRVSAVIINNKKILLVTGYKEMVYWTPGGKVGPDESDEDCLKRELNEELGVKIVSIKPYINYQTRHIETLEPMEVYCYLVEIAGKISPKEEITKFGWYSEEDIKNKKIQLTEDTNANLVPQLIIDKSL